MKRLQFILLVFLASVITAQSSNKEYLKAHWDFESVESDILLDVSGNSENGKIIGNPEIVPGVVGKCMRFSGNDYIELFDQLFLDNECNITATCWFKYETNPKATRQLFCISGNEENYDPITFQFSYSKPSDFSFEDCKSGYKAIRASKTNFPLQFQKDKWYFLTVVLCYNGDYSTLKIYIDGKLMEEVKQLSNMTEYTFLPAGKLCPTFHKPMAATIGTLINYPDWNWIGCIDEMKFFTTCLSEQDIQREMKPQGDCDSSYFKYNSFNDISRLKLLDAARHQDNAIVLTNSQKYKKGAIFRDVPVPLAEEWECTWAFSMHSPYKGSAPDNSLPGADGISLIIHNDPRELEAIGNTGMGIAYAGIENAIAIEIDLFNNDKYQIEDMKDPNGNHIALMVNKDKGKLSAIHNDENPNFVNKNIFKLVSDGTKYYAKAYYNHNQRVLRVWLSKDENNYGDPVLDINNFNIRDYINFKDFGRAYIGIGAATGDANQTHVLHSWSLCPKTQYGTLISSVDDEEDTDYQFISPNPASDMLNVRLPNGITTGNIIIYGYMGNVVMNQYTSSSKNRIDISRLPIGVYFIKVLSGGTMHDIGKCIKQ